MKSFKEFLLENNSLIKLIKQYEKLEIEIDKLNSNTSSIKDFGSESKNTTLKDNVINKISKKRESLKKVTKKIEKISNTISETEWDDILSKANIDVEEYQYQDFNF